MTLLLQVIIENHGVESDITNYAIFKYSNWYFEAKMMKLIYGVDKYLWRMVLYQTTIDKRPGRISSLLNRYI